MTSNDKQWQACVQWQTCVLPILPCSATLPWPNVNKNSGYWHYLRRVRSHFSLTWHILPCWGGSSVCTLQSNIPGGRNGPKVGPNLPSCRFHAFYAVLTSADKVSVNIAMSRNSADKLGCPYIKKWRRAILCRVTDQYKSFDEVTDESKDLWTLLYTTWKGRLLWRLTWIERQVALCFQRHATNSMFLEGMGFFPIRKEAIDPLTPMMQSLTVQELNSNLPMP